MDFVEKIAIGIGGIMEKKYECTVDFYYYYREIKIVLTILGEDPLNVKITAHCGLEEVGIVRCKLCNGIIGFKLLKDIAYFTKKSTLFTNKAYVCGVNLNKMKVKLGNYYIIPDWRQFNVKVFRGRKTRELRKPVLYRLSRLHGFCGRSCCDEYKVCS